MVNVDFLGILLYAQAILSITLFFFVQILAVFAHDRFEGWADWAVYRGTWVGMFIQVISVMILAALVFYAHTDHARVTYTGILIVANAAWFTTLRLSFLIADYRCDRQVRRKEQ